MGGGRSGELEEPVGGVHRPFAPHHPDADLGEGLRPVRRRQAGLELIVQQGDHRFIDEQKEAYISYFNEAGS